MSHVLVVVSRRYNWHELWDALKELKHRKHTFDVVSSALVIKAENGKGHPNKLERTIDDITSMDGFDGIIVISGRPSDTEFFWTHKGCQALVKQASERNLVVAALCSAVPAIRLAAEGRMVSVYPLFKSLALLEQAGAIINKASLSTDGKVVTAENEMMTTMWATNVCDVLEGKPPTHTLEPSSFARKRIVMKTDPDLQRVITVMRSKHES